MKVLVIIVSYNFERWIDRCLGSLQQSEYPVDIVVIDNASQDHTVQRIQKDYPSVRLIESKTNLGFGKANNIGMQIALEEGYDAVFLMNQDAWIAKDSISILARLCQEESSFGIISPVHLTGNGDKPDPGFGTYAKLETLSQLPEGKELMPLPFVNAAFWMIPVSVLKKVGGFCPLFYHYGEDKDFVNRLQYHGYHMAYSPKAFGCHDREYRPLTHEGFLRTEYVYHLSEYTNILHAFPKAFGYAVLATFKKAVESLLKGKFKLSVEYLSMSFRLLAKSGDVCRYRKQNKLSNPNYIQS